jgi:hypothetical protein
MKAFLILEGALGNRFITAFIPDMTILDKIIGEASSFSEAKELLMGKKLLNEFEMTYPRSIIIRRPASFIPHDIDLFLIERSDTSVVSNDVSRYELKDGVEREVKLFLKQSGWKQIISSSSVL